MLNEGGADLFFWQPASFVTDTGCSVLLWAVYEGPIGEDLSWHVLGTKRLTL